MWLNSFLIDHLTVTGILVELLINLAIQSTLILAIGLMAARLFGANSAVRSAILKATLACLIVAPLMMFGLQRFGIQGMGFHWSQDVPLESDPLFSERTSNQSPLISRDVPVPFADGHAGHISPLVDARVDTTTEDFASTESGISASVRNANADSSLIGLGSRTLRWLAIIWVAASSLMVLRLFGAIYWLNRTCNQAASGSPAMLTACRTVAESMGVRTPRVLAHAGCGSPCLVGVIRPAILIPQTLPRLSHEVIAHELAHLRRNDCAWCLAAQVVIAIMPWQPLVWLLARQLAQAADEVCDDVAISWSQQVDDSDRVGFARELVDLAEQFQYHCAPVTAVGIALTSSAGQRVKRILDTTRDLSTGTGTRTLIWISTIGTAACLAAGWMAAPDAPTALHLADQESQGDLLTTDTLKLPFPDDQLFGMVEEREMGTTDEYGWLDSGPWLRSHPAQGAVTVSRSSWVHLTINDPTERHWLALSRLPADAIDELTVEGCTLGQASLEQIGRLTALSSVRFDNCTFPDDVPVDEIQSPPSVKMIDYRATQEQQIRSFVKWAAACPELRFLYCGNRPPNATELQPFKAHSSATFLHVNIDADAPELFDLLSTLPNLRALNAENHEYNGQFDLSGIARLKNVSHVSLFGGLVDESLVDNMSQIAGLKSLQIQNQAELSAEFPDVLPKLENLERLILQSGEAYFEKEELHEALCQLKNLKHWPDLESPDKATLQALAKVEGRTNIDIQELGDDASDTDLAAVLDTDSLEVIRLGRVNFTPEIAKAIQRNRGLKHLSLDVREFFGEMLGPLDKHADLTSVNLSVYQNTTGLDVLCQLPALDSLQLRVHSEMPKDLEVLKNCPRLRILDIHGGYKDDSTAKWIGESKSIRHVGLIGECFMTDAAIDLFCRNRGLESLSFEGEITKDAALRLLDLPRINRIDIRSDSMTEEERVSLTQEIEGRGLEYVNIKPNTFPTSRYLVGADGFKRQNSRDRKQLDQLEGTKASKLFPAEIYQSLQPQIAGKVVLVDFWGVWCNPCKVVNSHIKDLYGALHHNGLEVVSIHTSKGLDQLDDYLKTHPIEWTNLLDTEDKLSEIFGVQRYPTIFLFDRSGVLRVAEPHRLGTEEAIRLLLNERL